MFDPERLIGIIAELSDRLPRSPHEAGSRDDKLKGLAGTLTLVDATLITALPRIRHASMRSRRSESGTVKWRLHTHFEVDRHVPSHIDVTPSGGGDHDEHAVLNKTFEPDRLTVRDRGYAKFLTLTDGRGARRQTEDVLEKQRTERAVLETSASHRLFKSPCFSGNLSLPCNPVGSEILQRLGRGRCPTIIPRVRKPPSGNSPAGLLISVLRSRCKAIVMNTTFRATLETFPNPYPQRDYSIETVCPEFTSVCPKTGQPDFGVLTITYVPNAVCYELKSLKLYLQQFRNHGAFYEYVTNMILDDLVAVTQPRSMKIIGAFTPRGGIRTSVIVEYAKPIA